jgi:Flp pilus assembly pilin Flp
MEIKETVEKIEEKKAERGAGLIEYALLAAIIVGVAVVARSTISTSVSKTFSSVSSGVDSSVN